MSLVLKLITAWKGSFDCLSSVSEGRQGASLCWDPRLTKQSRKTSECAHLFHRGLRDREKERDRR